MMPIDRFERQLPMALTDLADPRTPDYLTDILGRTARTRQRPAWASIERWLPMELVTSRVPATRLPLRQLGVLALIAILLAALFAVYVGSQQSRLPAPFGPAANGVVAYAEGGDIYVADPSTGNARLIVGGPQADLRPIFSPDGSKVVFERKVEGSGDQGHLYVANWDGSGLIQATIDPFTLTPSQAGDPYQFSPDGRSIVVAARRGSDDPGLYLVATDGSGDRPLDLAVLKDRVTTAGQATFRPPDGKEILFVGTDGDAVNGGPGLYTVNVADGTVRTIVEADAAHELDLGTWSPDGRSLSYAIWDTTADGLTVKTHIVAADGTGDRAVPMPDGAVWQLGAAWSNDGTRLHLVRGYTPGWEESRPVIVPVAGTDSGIEIPAQGPVQQNCCYSWKWSPDDTMIIGKPIDPSGRGLQQVIIDVAGRTIRTAPWTSTADPVMQRRAP